MNQEDIIQELNKITNELESIEKSMVIETKSIVFLGSQADMLIKRANSNTISMDEKEQIYKQMDALQARMKLEERMISSRGKKADELEKRFNELVEGYKE